MCVILQVHNYYDRKKNCKTVLVNPQLMDTAEDFPPVSDQMCILMVNYFQPMSKKLLDKCINAFFLIPVIICMNKSESGRRHADR